MTLKFVRRNRCDVAVAVLENSFAFEENSGRVWFGLKIWTEQHWNIEALHEKKKNLWKKKKKSSQF